jgi:uncharacterized protein (DUF58 family)
MSPFDPTELARFGGLALVARQVVEGFLTGSHRSPFKGFSVEFAEHRQYYPGDEIRRIDWRMYGKTDRYFVKEYEDETNLRAVLVLDASASMRYRGAQALSKFEYAQRVAASLAYLLLAQRDAVGLLTHDTKPRAYIPPKANAKHLLTLLTRLQGTKPGGETSLAGVWHDIAGRYLRRRGLAVLVSDCLDDAAQLAVALRHLRYHKHEVMLFHVAAPEEVDFPFTTATRFRDLERPDAMVAYDARRLRDDYLRNVAAHREALRKAACDERVDYQPLRTDEPVERALGAFLARRAAW